MKRILAISDIHGELEMFNELLQKVNYSPETDQLILVGDYVDRGPNSKGVIDRVMELKSQGAVVLRGNHDEMMVDAFHGREKAWERWQKNGCVVTLNNYDEEITGIACPLMQEFSEHVEFLDSLDYYYETEDYIFVHAGVVPDEHPEDSDPFQLVWIRDEFYDNYAGDKTVIFGHTPTPFLRGEEKSRHSEVFFGENNIIGIDGAATYGGRLNCLLLPSREVYHVNHPKAHEQ